MADGTDASDTAPETTYGLRRDRFAALRDAAARRSRTLSQVRLLAFLAFLAAGVWSELRPGTLPLALAAIALVAFIALIGWHQRVRARQQWNERLRALNEEGLRRIARDWQALPARPAPAGQQRHGYASDLDLFGSPSLGQLLGPTGTPLGRTRLDAWLLRAASAGDVIERQEAARELVALNDLRDVVAAHGRAAADNRPDEIERFLRWAEGPRVLSGRSELIWASRIIPVATVALMALDAAGVIGPPLWLFTLLGAVLLSWGPGRAVRATFQRAFAREGLFHEYPELFAAVAGARFQATSLRCITDALHIAGSDAARLIARLARLMHLADLRYSAQLYVPVQLLTLWDFHVLLAMERWQRAAGARVRGWLEAIADFEACSALAVLAHDHPTWAWPEPTGPDVPAVFDAAGLGHPMLADAVRVENDVVVGPPGTFLLVTGSNMSGKSTLLRAIGLNTVLALAGAPVCARRLTLPVVDLRTSIRVQDSLVEGVSYFMAQLERMKEIVTAADAAAAQSDGGHPPVLYLLDELLQGTNTAERRIAATRLIRHLVDRAAIGAVTTHDLELAAEPALADAVHAVHFTETVRTDGTGPAMTFDYRLRPGVATSSNALKLMEIVGLD